MLSAFASASNIGSVLQTKKEANPEVTNRAFALALQAVEIGNADQASADPDQWNIEQLESCMRSLHKASMKVKKRLLYAAAMLITYDHEITIAEAEFFRAVAESLDCPVPVLAVGRANPIGLPGS